MTAEELYQKEFGNADSIPKESVIRLLKHFAKALKIEREQALHIHDVVGRSEQLLAYTEWLKKEGLLNATVSKLIVKKYQSK